MTNDQALAIAIENHKAYRAAEIERLFRNGPEFDAFTKYGYRHGWYLVGDYAFSHDEVTGEKYDVTQGGWAYL